MVRLFRALFGILAFALFLTLWCLRIVFADDSHDKRHNHREH